MGAAMRMGAELSGGEFPISVFPHKIQRIIAELYASQGYSIDYIAAAMLSALVVSIGNSHLEPRMTTTSITKHSTSLASNAALWATIATMEPR